MVRSEASVTPMRLPGVTRRPLPDVLTAGIVDPDVFHTGYAIMAARYGQLGIRALLPLERVWAGTGSAARPGTARGHGGFHQPRPGLPAHPDGRRSHSVRGLVRRGCRPARRVARYSR